MGRVNNSLRLEEGEGRGSGADLRSVSFGEPEKERGKEDLPLCCLLHTPPKSYVSSGLVAPGWYEVKAMVSCRSYSFHMVIVISI